MSSCVPFPLEQEVVDDRPDILDGSEGAKEGPRVKNVQGAGCQEDHGTIHDGKVDFSSDAVPTIGELDDSVHGSDADGEGADGSSDEHQLRFLVQNVVASGWFVISSLEGLVVQVAGDELNGEDRVDGDGDHLEDYTA